MTTVYRYLTIITTLLLTSGNISAQLNLVPNPDFEAFNGCDSPNFNIPFTTHYESFNFPTVDKWVDPFRTSPNYFNPCFNDKRLKTPSNLFGYQVPHSGVAYAGLGIFFIDTTVSGKIAGNSEYIETKLLKRMEAGHEYYISFYACLADNDFTYSTMALDEIGIAFSDTFVTYMNTTTPWWPKMKADFTNTRDRFISDTTNWTKVEGIYTARGDEQYMVLGYFYEDFESVNFRFVARSEKQYYMSYYYIDDVCITDITDIKTTMSDTVICEYAFPLPLMAPENAAGYIWNTGDSSRSIQADTPGTYWVTSLYDCARTVDSFYISTESCKECIWLPTAFTPNKDGLNDLYRPKIICPVENYLLRIYNRWGNMIFESNNPQTGWNGNVEKWFGDNSTYYYYLTYNGVGSSETRQLKGSFILIR